MNRKAQKESNFHSRLSDVFDAADEENLSEEESELGGPANHHNIK